MRTALKIFNGFISSALCLVLAINASAATYYVRSDGSDSNDGLADNAGGAWLTIGKANTTATSAGDIVYFRAKDYRSEGAITITADGSSGSLIRWIGETNVIFSRLILNAAHYRHFKGIEIRHDSDLGASADGITMTAGGGSTFVKLEEMYIHHTSAYNVFFQNAHWLEVVRCTFAYPGYTTGGSDLREGACVANDTVLGDVSTNVTIWYNHFSHSSDYINGNGKDWIVVGNTAGPTPVGDYPSFEPHNDFYQDYGGTNIFVRGNICFTNTFADAHFALQTQAAAKSIIARNNVNRISGDNVTMLVGPDADNFGILHNAFNLIGGTASGGTVPIWGRNGSTSSTNNLARNNAFIQAHDGSGTEIFLVSANTPITRDHNISYPNFADAGSTDLNQDPDFEDVTALDFRLQAGSPAIDTGTNITRTVGGGTGTTITVSDATYFFGGAGVYSNEFIYVGADNWKRVASVDHSANTITLSESITWADGEDVGYAYLGSGPDRGPIEYGGVFLSGATLSHIGNNYTAEVVGDWSHVDFFKNGFLSLRVWWTPGATTAAYGDDGSGGITAIAYAVHPQMQTYFEATDIGAIGVGDINVTELRIGTIEVAP